MFDEDFILTTSIFQKIIIISISNKDFSDSKYDRFEKYIIRFSKTYHKLNNIQKYKNAEIQTQRNLVTGSR